MKVLNPGPNFTRMTYAELQQGDVFNPGRPEHGKLLYLRLDVGVVDLLPAVFIEDPPFRAGAPVTRHDDAVLTV